MTCSAEKKMLLIEENHSLSDLKVICSCRTKFQPLALDVCVGHSKWDSEHTEAVTGLGI